MSDRDKDRFIFDYKGIIREIEDTIPKVYLASEN